MVTIVTHTEAHNWSRCREKESGVLSSKWDTDVIPMPPKAQGSLHKSRQEECKGQRQMSTTKQNFLDTTGQLHTWTHCEFDNTHKICTRDKIPEWRGEVGMESYSWLRA